MANLTQQPNATQWSDAFIPNLPQELISKVTSYLTTDDLIECACVSVKWHVKVQPLLYRSLQLTDRHRFKQFHKLLEDSTRKTKRRRVSYSTEKPRIRDIGHYIYALKLGDGILTTNLMEQLAIQCPYVRKLHFSWNNILREPVSPYKMTRAFRSPKAFLQHFQPSNLVQLTLHCLTAKISYLSAVTDALCYTPQLESLELDLLLSVTVKEMENLHSQLPRLTNLRIGLTEARVEDATFSLSELEAIRPAERMQSLTFLSDIWSHHLILQSIWFKYILNKYPGLKQLGLCRPSRADHRRLTTEATTTSTTTDTTIIMRNHFPELQTLCLGVLAGQHSVAWPNLFTGVPKVKLCDASTSNAFASWIQSDATNQVKHLVLSALPTSISQIGHCTHIKHLELHGNFPTGAYQELPLGTILSDCKSLETMDISHCTIYYSHAVPTAKSCKSPLKTLTLNETLLLTHDSLAYIGVQCPQLAHLKLDRCAWCMKANVPIIRIHMPQQWFTCLEIVKPMIFSEYLKADGIPFQQAGYIPLELNHVANEYLVLKTPIEESSTDISSLLYSVISWLNPFNMLNMQYNGDLWNKHNLQLIHVSRCDPLYRIALTKIMDFNIKEWSSLLANDSNSNRVRAKRLARELMVPLVSSEDGLRSQHCITTLYCRGAPYLYIDGARVILDE